MRTKNMAINPGFRTSVVLKILERCELYKQLLEDYKMLMQSLVDQNKGVNHG